MKDSFIMQVEARYDGRSGFIYFEGGDSIPGRVFFQIELKGSKTEMSFNHQKGFFNKYQARLIKAKAKDYLVAWIEKEHPELMQIPA